MSVITKDLGIASAYGYAKSKGYTGTEEEFAELMASYADVAQQAEAAAQDAEDAKDAAVSAKNDAVTAKTAAESAQTAAAGSAQTASTKASEASGSAQAASGSATAAGNSATAASGSAQTAQMAAQTATTKASEAASSASAASTAKTGAETARTGAQTAQAAAETAQENAEAAAASVSASAAQIEQNTAEIGAIKNDLSELGNKVGEGIYKIAGTISNTINNGAITGTVGQQVEIGTQTTWKYMAVSCSGGDAFRVKTYMASNTAVTGYVYFVDANGIILDVQMKPTGTQEYVESIVTAPSETATMYAKLYVYGSAAVTVQSVEMIPLTDEINDVSESLVAFEVLPGPYGISFSGNTAQSDPLIINFNGLVYFRNVSNSSGDLTASISANTYSVSHGQALVFNAKQKALTVVNNGSGYLGSGYYILFAKQATQIKGQLAYIYYDALLDEKFNVSSGFQTKYPTVRLMSRQGEFLKPGTYSALPNNDHIGIRNASKNGYTDIRISVRATSDHVWVLMHDETINSVARNSDGTAISGDVAVSNHTLSELNEYDYGIKYGSEYAGETITTLEEALVLARKINLYVCVEIYPTDAISSADIDALCETVIKHGSVKSTNFRSPNFDILSAIHTSVPGANLCGTFYASDGDTVVQNKITALKAMKTEQNTIQMATVPETIGTEAFQSTIKRVIKEGIPLVCASVWNLDSLKTAIENGYCNVIEVANVENPYTTLYSAYI